MRMARKTLRKTTQKVLAYDLGGTKVHVGVVTSRGRIVEDIRVPVVVEEGKKAVFDQLGALGRAFLAKYPEIQKVGIASAGPLDPKRGLLLDPTNLGRWGQVPLAKELSRRLGRPVELENDAAAAILAEHWLGKAKGYDNAMILTLGTGLGTGIITNGELVRAGHHLHPEAGHIILRYGDRSAPCGCGNLGCAEAFLSGRSFARRARPLFSQPNLTAKDIADLARKGDPRALSAFHEYAEVMAVALCSYAVIYCPEIVLLTGSFADASSLFLPKVKTDLKQLLSRRRVGVDLFPKVAVSSLNNAAGLLGGAYIALNPRDL
jgi:glucokinase